MADFAERTPPYDLDAEQSVLACALVDQAVMSLVAGIVGPGHFYREGHGLIFGAIRRLHDDGQPIDLLTVKGELGAKLDEAGGWGYLVDLASSIPTTWHAEHHARIVRDKATLRALIGAGGAIMAAAFDARNAEEAHAAAVGLVGGIDPGHGSEDEHDMGAFLEGYMERLEQRGKGAKLTFDSGWYDVDQVWTGARGDLSILAARPACGKTAWALCYAWAVAQYARVDFWSLEMDRDRLLDRLVLNLEGLDYRRLKDGKLDKADWEAVARVTGRVAESGLRILKPKSLTAQTVRRAALKAKHKGQAPALVVIDYLQLMSHPKAERHDLAVGATTRELKLFAGEAGCQVMALAQLNRAVTKDNGRKPILSDLRDSGNIEQDADAVLFLHREAYSDPGAEQEGPCEVVVAKHRNGGVGTVSLNFEPKRQRFTVPAPSYAGHWEDL